MKYPKNVFITYCLYESQWWAAETDIEAVTDHSMKCSPEDRAQVLEYSFAALHFPSFSTDNVSHIIDEDPGLVCKYILYLYPIIISLVHFHDIVLIILGDTESAR